jgi:uncharacterized hydrophobic protein (TIGR00341 family)
MRQLIFQVPRGQGNKVLAAAKAHHAINLSRSEAHNEQGPIDVVTVHISNSRVENLLRQLEEIQDLNVTLFPKGVIALRPPASEAPDQVTDVQQRSPLEVFLAGLQSVGSWWGFLSYAALGGIVVWIGLYTNTNYLLVAAMLIAPFAGPAMNLAIATARGDRKLVGRSLLRYFGAISVSIIVAALLSLLFDQKITTEMMASISNISHVTVLLPLSAGIAGAIHLVQSERSSLVSGAAVGLLVAASLAPPAGLVGMTLATGRFEMMLSGVFQLLLQLVGINLVAAVVFRWRGLTVRGARYDRGIRWIFPGVLASTTVFLGLLLLWQFTNPPMLQRGSKSQQAELFIAKELQAHKDVYLLDVKASYMRAGIPDQHSLLCQVYVQRKNDSAAADSVLDKELKRLIQETIITAELPASPLVQLTIFDPPDRE